MTGARWTGTGRGTRALATCILLVAGASGCASAGIPLPSRPSPTALAPGSPLLSRSLGEGDAWLRHYLIDGEYDAALELLRRSAARPRDRLLHALQEAVVLHHAGRYQESNRRFEWAEQEAERRLTRSLSRSTAALMLNDKVLPYVPSAGEMAIIPYFRMLNYLALGRVQSAAVEARKSSAYVARLEDRAQGPCTGFGLVQYMAGLVYSAAGERNDALVALRRAERAFRECDAPGGARVPPGLAADLFAAARALGVEEVADSVAARYGLSGETPAAGETDLIVFLEQGFAAHRTRQDVYVPLFRSDVDRLGEGQSPATLNVAGQLIERLSTAMLAADESRHLWDQPRWRPTFADELNGSGNREIAYVMRLAWPVMRLEANRPAAVRLLVDGEAVDAPALEDVSARVVAGLESQRTAILARMVARGLVKYAASRGAEELAEKEGGAGLGQIVGFVANTAANALEQADTRSWSLLPDQIAVARLRVPAGERHVQLHVLDHAGFVSRVVDLGTIDARPGQPVFLSSRVWGTEDGDRERLMRLGIELHRTNPAPPSFGTAAEPLPPRERRAQRRRPSPPPPPIDAPGLPAPPVGANPTPTLPAPRPTGRPQ